MESLLAAGVLSAEAALEPTFLVGILLQVPFAFAALSSRARLRVARALVRTVEGARRPRLVSLDLLVPPLVDGWRPRLPALAFGYGERGPAPRASVASAWSRGLARDEEGEGETMSQSRRLYNSLGVGELLTEKAAVLLLLGAVVATAAILYGNAYASHGHFEEGAEHAEEEGKAGEAAEEEEEHAEEEEADEGSRSLKITESILISTAGADSCRSACSSPAAALAPWTSLRFRARPKRRRPARRSPREGTASSACFVPRWHSSPWAQR